VADDDARRLDRFAMLTGVSLPARAQLLFSSVERTLAAGDTLIRHGVAHGTMYFLLEGRLDVHLEGGDDDAPIATIGPGETVGELSLLDGSGASANVIAGTECTVLEVGEEAFWELTNSSHAFAVQLLVKLAERLRANNSAVSKNVARRRMYERAAMFDGLTGVHNRRWLDDTLHRIVDRHRRKDGRLCVALIDIDHFKSFNDRFGHAAGDTVLATVAAALAENLRPSDLVARFGGEEFVIIYPDTGLADAARVSERVRRLVAGLPLVTDDGDSLPNVTISTGVAELEPDQTVPSLLKVADAAMYRAKTSGRNRVLTGTVATLDD
jgi:diguanylate cyclase (GGDEF)-like protein